MFVHAARAARQGPIIIVRDRKWDVQSAGRSGRTAPRRPWAGKLAVEDLAGQILADLAGVVMPHEGLPACVDPVQRREEATLG